MGSCGEKKVRLDPPITNGYLVNALLDNPQRFKKEWLNAGFKEVVPVVASSSTVERLALRVSAGAREVGANYVLAGLVDKKRASEETIQASTIEDGPLLELFRRSIDLLALPDLSGAVLVTREGYALVAGSIRFVRTVLNEEIDEAKARFARNARRLQSSLPGLKAVAEDFQPHRIASSKPTHLAPGSSIAEQISLMRSLARGDITAAAFAPAWLAARRRALTAGERTRGALDRILVNVFYSLENYAADPDLRGPGDLSDEELIFQIRMALDELRQIENP